MNSSDFKYQWFKDAKYGLFIHFGLYSILGGSYQGKRSNYFSEWIMHSLDIPVQDYELLAKKLNPQNFDAKAIVQKALNWGMKYLCFTAKHHDGFALFNSKADDFNIYQRSPFQRDMVQELAAACQEKNLPFCLYYSQSQDWHHPDAYVANRDNSQKNFTRYLEEKAKPQIQELLSNYGKISMIWFDTPMQASLAESKSLIDLVKSIQPDCLINGRIGNKLGDYISTADNQIPALSGSRLFEVPATTNDSFAYDRDDQNWKDSGRIIRNLVKIVSKGGNYLLNIGPDQDFNIPSECDYNLSRVGHFLQTNGKSIYETRSLDQYAYEQKDFFFTNKGEHLYIHLFRDKLPQTLEITHIDNTIHEAYHLLTGKKIPFVDSFNLEGDRFWKFDLSELQENAKTDTIIDLIIAEDQIIMSELW